jgi:hypothetical protein
LTTPPQIPRSTSVDPLIETLPVGSELVQVFPRERGVLTFNATSARGRFRPVRNALGAVVPTAYLASDVETSLAETVLRGVTALEAGGWPRRLYRAELTGLSLTRVRLTQTLRVARLHGLGLLRLGLRRADVIDCDEDAYPYTAAWARALWGCRRRPAGIAWTSRQNDSGHAYLVWQTRLPTASLLQIGPELALDQEPGLDVVRAACGRGRRLRGLRADCSGHDTPKGSAIAATTLDRLWASPPISAPRLPPML